MNATEKLPEFIIHSSHEEHHLAVCLFGNKFLLYIMSYPSADHVQLGIYDTEEAVRLAFSAAMIAMQRVTR